MPYFRHDITCSGGGDARLRARRQGGPERRSKLGPDPPRARTLRSPVLRREGRAGIGAKRAAGPSGAMESRLRWPSLFVNILYALFR